jgi:IMP dehydrogenase
VTDVQIGEGKSARRAYGLGEIAVVPRRRTRDPEDVDIAWELEGFRFAAPFVVPPLDAVVTPDRAVEIGVLGGLAVLDLEGLWTRHADAEVLLAEVGALAPDRRVARIQELMTAPVSPDLLVERISAIRAKGVVAAGAVSAARTYTLLPAVNRAELDLLMIHGAVVSAEHVSQNREPLNLKKVIRGFEMPVIVGPCATTRGAMHLMRTGAVAVLVGVGAAGTSAVSAVLGIHSPMATALADCRAARARHLEETGVYVHLIAAGGMHTTGDVVKAFACGADAAMVGDLLAPVAAGAVWDRSAGDVALPRGVVVEGRAADLATVWGGPSRRSDGTENLTGALRVAMAACGYDTLRAFQQAEIVVCAELRA